MESNNLVNTSITNNVSEPSKIKKKLWVTDFINHFYKYRTYTKPLEDIILELETDEEEEIDDIIMEDYY